MGVGSFSYQVLSRAERRNGGGWGDWAVTLLGPLAASWRLGWGCGRPLEVNRAVRAFRAVIAHRRLTGLAAGLGFLAFLYFWTQRAQVRQGSLPLSLPPSLTHPGQQLFPNPAETALDSPPCGPGCCPLPPWARTAAHSPAPQPCPPSLKNRKSPAPP